MGKPKWWGRACDELRAGDPVLGAIIDRFPGEQLEPRAAPFFTLARAIAGQQISVRAAQTVWGRLETICGGAVTIEAVLARRIPATSPRSSSGSTSGRSR